jgi:hypothetical protein
MELWDFGDFVLWHASFLPPTMATLSAAETPLNISRAGSSQDLRANVSNGQTGVDDDWVEAQPVNGNGDPSGN